MTALPLAVDRGARRWPGRQVWIELT